MIDDGILTSHSNSPRAGGGGSSDRSIIRIGSLLLVFVAQIGLVASTSNNNNINSNTILQPNPKAATTTPQNKIVSSLLLRQGPAFRGRRRSRSSSSLCSSTNLRNSRRPASASLRDRISSFTTRPTSEFASSSSTEYDYDDDDDDYDDLPPKQKQPSPPPPPTTNDPTIQSEIKRAIQAHLGPYKPYTLTQRHSTNAGTSLTGILTAINILSFAAQTLYPPITAFGVKRSDLILSGRQLHRLITPIFLHGSPSHLILNTMSLSNIGPEVEKVFGTGRYLATYLVGGLVGNIASTFGTPNPSLGASGAVFGLMGAYCVCMGRNDKFFGREGERAMESVIGTLGINVVFGLMSKHVDNWAHIGGAVGGAAMAVYVGPKLYVMLLPTGGRLVVDRPSFQLPPSIESIPSKIGTRLRKGRLRMQVDRYASDISAAKPWRKRGSQSGGGGLGIGIGRGSQRRRRMKARGRRERGLPLDRRLLRPRFSR